MSEPLTLTRARTAHLKALEAERDAVAHAQDMASRADIARDASQAATHKRVAAGLRYANELVIYRQELGENS